MLARRLARGKEVAGRLRERRGLDATPRPPGPLLWLHAASVGETVSILPVLAHLVPACQVLLTTGTVTSAALAARRLPEMGLGTQVLHRFVPLDVPRWARRFLAHWRPDAACFVESELWPNLLAACRARGVPMALINARMSAKSLTGWQLLPRLAAWLLGGFAWVQAQSEADAARLRSLGATRVTAPGDLKFAAPALPADPAMLDACTTLLGNRPRWLAASTHPGEDATIFAAQAALLATRPDLLCILVPRHPERGAEIQRAAQAAGLAATRRAAGQAPPAPGGIWVADTLGELGLWYRLCRIAFVGRSLAAPGGGQNPLEGARLGCAVAVGPMTDNFAAATQALAAAAALTRVGDAAALAGWVARMLDDPAACAAAGTAGQAAAARYAELPAQTAAALLKLLERDRRAAR
ncbi:MAG: 3-deoxy-D-manno-octulosonic acid transferase [Rhodospirillales bacterium]|nr:3-deoxy-D-manno-octulosonic acid transferase [Rhodospirillales bacterium]